MFCYFSAKMTLRTTQSAMEIEPKYKTTIVFVYPTLSRCKYASNNKNSSQIYPLPLVIAAFHYKSAI